MQELAIAPRAKPQNVGELLTLAEAASALEVVPQFAAHLLSRYNVEVRVVAGAPRVRRADVEAVRRAMLVDAEAEFQELIRHLEETGGVPGLDEER
jgi:hypothetical protein